MPTKSCQNLQTAFHYNSLLFLILFTIGIWKCRETLNQILVNEYRFNMGILNHFDDSLAFGPSILTISLGEPMWMNLSLPSERRNDYLDLLKSTRVYLERRSLFVMQDESRKGMETRHFKV